MSNDKDQDVHLPQPPLRVINLGLERFSDDLDAQRVEVVQVDWSPPAGGNPRLAALLEKLGV